VKKKELTKRVLTMTFGRRRLWEAWLRGSLTVTSEYDPSDEGFYIGYEMGKSADTKELVCPHGTNMLNPPEILGCPECIKEILEESEGK